MADKQHTFELYETVAVTSSVKDIDNLDMPSLTYLAEIQADGGTVVYTTDGVSTPGSLGIRLFDQSVHEIRVDDLKQIQFVRDSADCQLNLHYHAYAAAFEVPPVVTGLRQTLFANTLPSATYVYDETEAHGTDRALQPGRCYNFDGSDDYTIVPHDADLSFGAGESLTLSLHFNQDGGQIATFLIKGRDAGLNPTNYAIRATSGQGIEFYYRDSTNTTWNIWTSSSSGLWLANEWHHIAFGLTFGNGSSAVCYLDGVEIPGTWTFGTGNDTPAEPSQGLWLGRYEGANEKHDGKLFDVRIYGKQLSQAEVLHVLNFGEQGDDPGVTDLLGHWKLDEGAGFVAFDSSGNGHHGTNTNVTVNTFNYEGADVPYSWQNEAGSTVHYTGTFNNEIVIGTSTQSFPLSLMNTGVSSTVALWVFLETLAPGANMVAFEQSNGASDRYVIWFDDTSDVLNFFCDGDNITSLATAETGRWYHLTCVVDGTNMEFFLDGVSQGTTTYTAADVNVDTWIGSSPVSTGQDWAGGIRDVKVFDRALDVNEALFLATNGTSGNDPGATDLVAHYKLDDAEGVYARDSIGTQHGKISDASSALNNWAIVPRDESDTANDVLGQPLQSTGVCPVHAKLSQSNCATFDGSNDFIYMGNPYSLPTDWTMAAWVNWNGASAGAVIGRFDGTGGYSIYVTATGQVQAYSGTGYARVNSTPVIASGVWTHVMARWNGTSLQVWFDGVEVETTTSGTPADPPASGHFNLGANSPDGVSSGSRFPGSICDAQYYEAAIADGDIRLIYEGGTADSVAVLGHWPLSEGGGHIAYDISGNGNDGTCTNITTSTFWGTKQDVYHHNIREGFDQVGTLDSADYIVWNETPLDLNATSFTMWMRFCTTDTSFRLWDFRGTGTNGDQRGIQVGCLNNPDWRNIVIDDGAGNYVRFDGAAFNEDDDEWHSLGITFDTTTGTAKLYIDGTLADTQTDANLINANLNPDGRSPRFGNAADTGTHQYSGEFRDLRLYDVVLEAGDISSLHSGTSITTDPRGSWPIDEGYGLTVYDRIGTKHGTAEGVTEAELWALKIPAGIIQTTPNHPAGPYHNGAETELDFTGGVSFPGSSTWTSDWAFHDARTNPEFARELTSQEVVVRVDRFLTYNDALTGSDLTEVENFVISTEVV